MLGSAKAAPEASESLLEHFAQVGKKVWSDLDWSLSGTTPHSVGHLKQSHHWLLSMSRIIGPRYLR